MKRFIGMYFDDILILAGCVCILYGLAMWNVIVTWIVGGLMLIGFAILVGKAKAKNVT